MHTSSSKAMLISRNWLFIYFLPWPLATETEAQNMTFSSDDYIELASVVLTVTLEHFKTPVVVIAEHSVTAETGEINLFLMNYLLKGMKDLMAVQLDYSELREQIRGKKFIFIVDSVEAFRVLRRRFNSKKDGRHFYFFIILSPYKTNFYGIMRQIFKICFLFKIIDVVITLNHPALGICMFTYKLFTERHCRAIQPKLFFRMQTGLDNLKVLFPSRLNNFYKCPLRVTGRLFPPLLDFLGNSSDPKPVGNWDNLGGIEGSLIRLLSQSLNFTINLIPFPQEKSFALENRSAYGCFADILNNRADIALGGFSASDPSHELFTTSKFIYQAPLVFVYNPQNRISSLGRLSKPYSQSSWILIFCLCIFCIILILVMRLASPTIREFLIGDEKTNTPILNLTAVLFGYPMTRMPHRTFARYLLAMWLLLCLVIRNAYQGGLYDAMRLDSLTDIPTGLDDLLQRNFTFVIPLEAALSQIVPEDRTIPYMGIDFMKIFEILENSKQSYATVALRDNFLSYMSRAYFTGSRLFCMGETIFMYQVAMFYSKNSILLHTFDRKLGEFHKSGIIDRLNKAYTANRALWIKVKENHLYKNLNNQSLVALYEVYLGLTVLAIFVFGLELLSKRFEKLRRIFDWLG